MPAFSIIDIDKLDFYYRPPSDKLAPFSLFPYYQQHRSDKNRVEHTDDNTGEQHHREILNGSTDEQYQGYHRKKNGQTRINRPAQCLKKTVIDDYFVFRTDAIKRVFPDTVENNNRIVDTETEYGQHPGNEHQIDLPLQNTAKDGKYADGYQDIMQQSNDSRGSVTEGVRHLTKGPNDIQQHEYRRHYHRNDYRP